VQTATGTLLLLLTSLRISFFATVFLCGDLLKFELLLVCCFIRSLTLLELRTITFCHGYSNSLFSPSWALTWAHCWIYWTARGILCYRFRL